MLVPGALDRGEVGIAQSLADRRPIPPTPTAGVSGRTVTAMSLPPFSGRDDRPARSGAIKRPAPSSAASSTSLSAIGRRDRPGEAGIGRPRTGLRLWLTAGHDQRLAGLAALGERIDQRLDVLHRHDLRVGAALQQQAGGVEAASACAGSKASRRRERTGRHRAGKISRSSRRHVGRHMAGRRGWPSMTRSASALRLRRAAGDLRAHDVDQRPAGRGGQHQRVGRAFLPIAGAAASASSPPSLWPSSAVA